MSEITVQEVAISLIMTELDILELYIFDVLLIIIVFYKFHIL